MNRQEPKVEVAIDVLAAMDHASDAFPAYSASAKILLDARAAAAELIDATNALSASFSECARAVKRARAAVRRARGVV